MFNALLDAAYVGWRPEVVAAMLPKLLEMLTIVRLLPRSTSGRNVWETHTGPSTFARKRRADASMSNSKGPSAISWMNKRPRAKVHRLVVVEKKEGAPCRHCSRGSRCHAPSLQGEYEPHRLPREWTEGPSRRAARHAESLGHWLRGHGERTFWSSLGLLR